MSDEMRQYAETFRRLYNKNSLAFGESGRLMEAALRLADACLAQQAALHMNEPFVDDLELAMAESDASLRLDASPERTRLLIAEIRRLRACLTGQPAWPPQ